MRFRSKFERIGSCDPPIAQGSEWPEATIRNEPMLFSADYDFALASTPEEGLTRRFLAKLPEEWGASDLIIDSRVHMLMPGFIPAIPGWHLDAVPRTADGQPDVKHEANVAQHIICFVGPAPTDLLTGTAILTQPPEGMNVYAHWDREINNDLAIPERGLKVEQRHSNDMVKIDSYTFHRATPSPVAGWRFFIRASRFTSSDARNEIRTQTQVYLVSAGQGW